MLNVMGQAGRPSFLESVSNKLGDASWGSAEMAGIINEHILASGRETFASLLVKLSPLMKMGGLEHLGNNSAMEWPRYEINSPISQDKFPVAT